jgi:hypothetical protein
MNDPVRPDDESPAARLDCRRARLSLHRSHDLVEWQGTTERAYSGTAGRSPGQRRPTSGVITQDRPSPVAALGCETGSAHRTHAAPSKANESQARRNFWVEVHTEVDAVQVQVARAGRAGNAAGPGGQPELADVPETLRPAVV